MDPLRRDLKQLLLGERRSSASPQPAQRAPCQADLGVPLEWLEDAALGRWPDP